MADQQTAVENPAASAATENTETVQPETVVPKGRFDEVAKRAYDAEKKLKALEAAKEQEATKALKENSQFKELSEQQAQKLIDLETKLTQADTVTQERDKYKTALEAHVKERRKGVPAHILEILDVLDPLAQMAWLDKNTDKLTTQVGGVPATPRAETPAAPNIDDLIRQRRQTDSRYSSF
jgi:hypothetical protein